MDVTRFYCIIVLRFFVYETMEPIEERTIYFLNANPTNITPSPAPSGIIATQVH